MGLLSSFFSPPPPVLPLLEISHQSHVGGRPSSPSQRRESEPDNDLGDNNRAEETKERWGEDGGRMAEKWWVVREVFFIVSPSLLNDYYPQSRRCLLPTTLPSRERGMLSIQPHGEETDGPVMSHNHLMGLLQSNCSSTKWRGCGGRHCCIESVWKYVYMYIHT